MKEGRIQKEVGTVLKKRIMSLIKKREDNTKRKISQ